jgi:thymidine phosphorylase
MDAWRAMIRAQGGDPEAALPAARETHTVTAEADGFVAAVDAYAIGIAAWRLGAGRARKEDPVSAAAGVLLHRRPGDPVRAGEPLFELRSDDPARFGAALEAAAGAVTISARPPAATPLVIDRLA